MENVICKTFDQLTVRELYAIMRLRAEIFIVEQNCVYLDPDGLDPVALHLWTERDGAIAAYARVLPPNTYLDEIAIGRVVTREHRRGDGTRIFRAALQAAQEEWHASRVKIRAQLQAAPFYHPFGFHACAEPFLYEGLMHVDMLWQLNPEEQSPR